MQPSTSRDPPRGLPPQLMWDTTLPRLPMRSNIRPTLRRIDRALHGGSLPRSINFWTDEEQMQVISLSRRGGRHDYGALCLILAAPCVISSLDTDICSLIVYRTGGGEAASFFGVASRQEQHVTLVPQVQPARSENAHSALSGRDASARAHVRDGRSR
ncbi:hypothetical protein HDV57DRAFT_51122 [Trichoderma longibrachiatum]